MNRIAAMATSGTSDEPADPLLASENMPDTHDNATEININSSLKHRADKHTTPTLSHGIASENTDIIGDEQPRWRDSPAVEVGDLGWNTASNQMIRPIVEGVRNERLWTILRRFNQQTFEVRQIDETMLKNLDMSIGEDEEFSPDKLRAHLERLYVTVGLGCMSAWKHIARVRSWKEPNRTWTFFSVYYVSWLLDLLLPAIVLCALVLVISPPVRTLCFPPAPLALVDAASGGVQRPAAGLLATADTMTGAPEAFDGEGAEREAHNVINTIATVSHVTLRHVASHQRYISIHDRPTETIKLVPNHHIFSRWLWPPLQVSIQMAMFMTTTRRQTPLSWQTTWPMQRMMPAEMAPAQPTTKPKSQYLKLCGNKLRPLCAQWLVLLIRGSALPMQ